MSVTSVKEQLHYFIDAIDNERAVELYEQLASELPDENRKKMIDEERSKYLQGEGRSYSWEEVKSMATNKNLRSELLHH